MNILEASPDDVAGLYKLAAESMPYDTFSEELLSEKLFFNPYPDRDEYHTLVAKTKDECIGLLQYVIRAGSGLAWLGLFAVEQAHRRRHIGNHLFNVALQAWRTRHIHTIDVLTIPSNYLVPGLDPRYTPAVCFLESLGFKFKAEKINMRTRLDRNFDSSDLEAILKTKGIIVRRAQTNDERLIMEFFQRFFGEGWLAEVLLGMKQRPPAVHLAIKDNAVLGFAAHSTMNREWGNFGPMGTAEEARGLGIGRVLLFRCMNDLKNAGFDSVVIPWVGPYRYYSRLLNCAIERVFWQYRLQLQ